MRKIVFAGPSMPAGLGCRPFGLEIRPPARKGDLIEAANDGATVIGLVDGLFGSQPSVWHKEILYCLSRGIVVAGAASMGALRAAECARFGMIGIGAIFEDYHAGRRSSDADVAVLHAPPELGYSAVTVALVDVEAAAARLAGAGTISADEAARLCEAARAIHFTERDWRTVLSRYEAAGFDPARLASAMPALKDSLKSQDCLALLEYVRDFDPAQGRPGAKPAFRLQNTAFLTGLVAAVSKTPSG